MRKSIITVVLATCFVILCLHGQTLAQPAYPTKPVDVIVAFSPGGGTDISARLITGYLSKKGFQMNVINKPGGGAVIGTREALIARPDGYTMLGDGHASSSALAAFSSKLPFDWQKRTWLGRTIKEPVVFQVPADAPYKTLKELAEFIKKNPKKVRWGTTGVSGIGSPAGIQFFQANNISVDMVNQVMFEGSSKVVTAVAGGHVDFTAAVVSTSWGMLEGKKNRPLAVTAEKRLSILPDVPTVAEAGYPMLDVIGWYGVSGPAGLPKHVVDFWVTELGKACKDPVFQQMAENTKNEVSCLGPKEFEEFVKSEYIKYKAMDKDMKAAKQ
jgi:tripartite-type tricarboxylate transporter receptor subunit TctC